MLSIGMILEMNWVIWHPVKTYKRRKIKVWNMYKIIMVPNSKKEIIRVFSLFKKDEYWIHLTHKQTYSVQRNQPTKTYYVERSRLQNPFKRNNHTYYECFICARGWICKIVFQCRDFSHNHTSSVPFDVKNFRRQLYWIKTPI